MDVLFQVTANVHDCQNRGRPKGRLEYKRWLIKGGRLGFLPGAFSLSSFFVVVVLSGRRSTAVRRTVSGPRPRFPVVRLSSVWWMVSLHYSAGLNRGSGRGVRGREHVPTHRAPSLVSCDFVLMRTNVINLLN